MAAQGTGAVVDGGGSLVAAQEAGAAVGGGSLAAAEEDGGDGDEVVDHTSANRKAGIGYPTSRLGLVTQQVGWGWLPNR